MNRNYGFRWQPSYVQGGAGDFPMSAKPTRAVADFILTKPNICFNVAFHNMGGLIVRGPGSKLSPAYPPSDVRVYDFLGREGEKILPGYRYIEGGKDMYTTHGDFDEFMFSNLGIYGFVGELYMSILAKYRKVDRELLPGGGGGDPEDEERLKFDDFVNQGKYFKEWEKFNHPQFGEIEIGGWTRFAGRIGPPFMIQEMVHRNASLVIFCAEHTPEITLTLLGVKDLGNGLKRVRVRAENPRAIPTLSQLAVRKKIYRQDMFRLEGGGLEVVSGGVVQDALYDRVDYKEHRPEAIFSTVPSFGKRDIQWIVKGSGQATITYEAVKTTNRTISITLQ
jgi:hypothetical protein